MKEWVRMAFNYSNNWTVYAKLAMEYVSEKQNQLPIKFNCLYLS